MVNRNLNGGDLVNNLLKFGIVNANGNQNNRQITWRKGKGFRLVSKDEQVAEVRKIFDMFKKKL